MVRKLRSRSSTKNVLIFFLLWIVISWADILREEGFGYKGWEAKRRQRMFSLKSSCLCQSFHGPFPSMSVTKGLWTRKKLMQRIGTAMIEHHSLSGSSYSIFFSYDRTSQPLRFIVQHRTSPFLYAEMGEIWSGIKTKRSAEELVVLVSQIRSGRRWSNIYLRMETGRSIMLNNSWRYYSCFRAGEQDTALQIPA